MHENKFTPRAEEALRLAQEAGEEMGHGYVGTEHLLLGLLREEEGIAHRALTECGLTDELVCTIVQRSVGTGLSGAAPSQGLTPRAKSAVELAVSEAVRTKTGYIGTEHLLMGILREGNNMALIGLVVLALIISVVCSTGFLIERHAARTQEEEY
jgi:ATP-dependent Clp protease ATP-binding subunit ClpC